MNDDADDLAATFLAHVRDRGVAPVEGSSLAASLARALEIGRAAWPGIEISPTRFVVYLADRAGRGAPPAGVWSPERLSDLWLACACSEGDPKAAAAFERTFAPVVERVLAQRRIPTQIARDVAVDLLDRLLVGADGAKPRIADFAGAGPLAGWVAIVAVRSAFNATERERARDVHEQRAAEDPWLVEDDPELEHLRRLYGDEFRGALEDGLAALEPEERTLLRLHYVDGLAMEKIAKTYGIVRLTVFRRIERARGKLREAACASLVARLGANHAEAESVAQLLRSKIDLSLGRLLESTTGRD